MTGSRQVDNKTVDSHQEDSSREDSRREDNGRTATEAPGGQVEERESEDLLHLDTEGPEGRRGGQGAEGSAEDPFTRARRRWMARRRQRRWTRPTGTPATTSAGSARSRSDRPIRLHGRCEQAKGQ